jgi:hypothetical protein
MIQSWASKSHAALLLARSQIPSETIWTPLHKIVALGDGVGRGVKDVFEPPELEPVVEPPDPLPLPLELGDLDDFPPLPLELGDLDDFPPLPLELGDLDDFPPLPLDLTDLDDCPPLPLDDPLLALCNVLGKRKETMRYSVVYKLAGSAVFVANRTYKVSGVFSIYSV